MAKSTRTTRTPRTEFRTDGRPRTTVQSAGNRDDDVHAFFDTFARFLTAGEGDRIAQMWEYPALVVGETTLMAVNGAEETAKFFGGAKEQYNERGIADTRAEIQRSSWLTDRIVTVTVRWPYLDENESEIGEETSTYTLRRSDDGELRLCVAIMHGAKDG